MLRSNNSSCAFLLIDKELKTVDKDETWIFSGGSCRGLRVILAFIEIGKLFGKEEEERGGSICGIGIWFELEGGGLGLGLGSIWSKASVGLKRIGWVRFILESSLGLV